MNSINLNLFADAPRVAVADASAVAERYMPRTSPSPRPPTLAAIERARARLSRSGWVMPRPFLIDATHASFRIEGINASLEQVARAIGHQQRVRAFRSPLSHRIRAHASILRCCERLISTDRPLRGDHVVRWYTGLSAGVTSTPIESVDVRSRVESIVSRLNAPTSRLSSAIAEAVTLYHDLLRDPVVPGYNGIVARLMLNLQLGRSGLLPVIIDPAGDGRDDAAPIDEAILIGLLGQRYDLAGVL